MITILGSFATVEQWVGRLHAQLAPTVDMTVESALDELIAELVPSTPVVSGDMAADYTIAVGQGVWELLDTAQSPGGYDYPGRVVGEPGFSASYDQLNTILDSAEGHLYAALDAALTTLTSAP